MILGRCSRFGSVLCALLTVLLSSSASAWELQSKSLEDAVSESQVVVVGKTASIISHYQSEIAGVGSLWKLSLEVTNVLKGSVASDTITITFASVEMAEAAFDPRKEYLWLLQYPRNSNTFALGYENIYVTKNFASVYPSSIAPDVAEIVQLQSIGSFARTDVATK